MKKSDPRMQTAEFIPLYLDAVAAGMIREDFAESLGVNANTVYQRIYEMHQKGGDKKVFPQLQTRGKRSFTQKINDAVADWEKSKGKKAVIRAAVKATEQQPEPKARKRAAKTEPVLTPPDGPDGDVDTNAFLDQLLNG